MPLFTEKKKKKKNKPGVRVEISALRQSNEKVLEDIQVGHWGMPNQMDVLFLSLQMFFSVIRPFMFANLQP